MLTLDDFKKLSDLLYTARLYCNETDSPLEEAVRGLDHLQLCEALLVLTNTNEDCIGQDDIIDTGNFLEDLHTRAYMRGSDADAG